VTLARALLPGASQLPLLLNHDEEIGAADSKATTAAGRACRVNRLRHGCVAGAGGVPQSRFVRSFGLVSGGRHTTVGLQQNVCTAGTGYSQTSMALCEDRSRGSVDSLSAMTGTDSDGRIGQRWKRDADE
jgi:hypothetical protein